MVGRRLALAVMLTLFASCNDAGLAPPAAVCGGYVVADAAKLGCRSPEAPGCAVCCLPQAGGCVQLSSGGSPTNQPGWYNDVTNIAGACAAGCPRCASCAEHDEQQLCALLETHQSCDCAHLPASIDPCVTRGCQCYCASYAFATAACPAR